MHELLNDVIAKDHSMQVTSQYFVDLVLLKEKISNVMDLGCGKGNSIDYFRMKNSSIRWTGVDIELSPETNLQNKTGGNFIIYDGINLPFKSDVFDMVFCNQVFHHVRYPRELLKEIRRVLRVEGYLIGSVSYLEPYQSLSLWNYTPYGFKILIKESGMELKEIRPGIDALTLIARRMLGCHKFFSRYWKVESPLNRLIDFIGFIAREGHFEINLKKLLFCGQFAFLVQRK